jgi:hypothetical protein
MAVKKQQLPREELPDVLDPIHIQQFLNISRKKNYEFLLNPPFHIVKVGRLIKVPRVTFLKWFDGDEEIKFPNWQLDSNAIRNPRRIKTTISLGNFIEEKQRHLII